jgi:hypothetical protein
MANISKLCLMIFTWIIFLIIGAFPRYLNFEICRNYLLGLHVLMLYLCIWFITCHIRGYIHVHILESSAFDYGLISVLSHNGISRVVLMAFILSPPPFRINVSIKQVPDLGHSLSDYPDYLGHSWWHDLEQNFKKKAVGDKASSVWFHWELEKHQINNDLTPCSLLDTSWIKKGVTVYRSSFLFKCILHHQQ